MTGWKEWVERLCQDDRYIEVVDVATDTALVRVLLADPPPGRPGVALVWYALDPARELVVVWAGYYDSGFFLSPTSVLAHERQADGSTRVSRLDQDGSTVSEQTIANLAGRVGRIRPARGDGGVVASVMPDPTGNTTESEPFDTIAGVTWSDSSRASLGAARRSEQPWQIWRLPGGQPLLIEVDLPPAVQLTGEFDTCVDGLVVGIARADASGTQRFGVLHRRHDGSQQTYLSPSEDFGDPTGSPSGGRVALAATSVPTPDAPPLIFPAVLDVASGRLDRYPSLSGWWPTPSGWVGETQLLLLVEERSHRCLGVVDLDTDHLRVEERAGSVLSVKACPATTAAVVSAPGTPPRLELAGSGPSATVAQAGADDDTAVDLPLTYRSVVVDGLDLGAWICGSPAGAAGLVGVFHGGPFKSWSDWSARWSPWPLVAAGFCVALIETPMSVGYGPESTRAGWRNWRHGIADVAAREVSLVRRDLGLNGQPLALMGGSFGGYVALVAAESLRPDLVVAHAPPADPAVVASTSDTAWQWIREYGHPAEHPDLYSQQKVRVEALSTRTRVLLSHGLLDDLVPAGESLALHRTLLARGYRSELAVFSRLGHPLVGAANLRGWYEWVITACLAAVAEQDR
jgi:dipeptidyl aminopeptidase/acylaminoacyl peptidase